MNARARSWRRHATSRLMTVLVIAFSFLAVLALILILGNLVVKGASSIDWAFFTKSPVPAGQSGGGVANAIVGTALIVATLYTGYTLYSLLAAPMRAVGGPLVGLLTLFILLLWLRVYGLRAATSGSNQALQPTAGRSDV